MPKTLVIDTSIARAAGGEQAQCPRSAHAREFLRTVLDVGHFIGMTPAIKAEWDKHQSRYSLKWRATMVARRQLIPLDIQEDAELRERLNSLQVSENDRKAMLKDCHLLEAASAFDQRIASMDIKAHELFKQASLTLKTIRKLIWVNPILDAEKIQLWLKQGAQHQKDWELNPARKPP